MKRWIVAAIAAAFLAPETPALEPLAPEALMTVAGSGSGPSSSPATSYPARKKIKRHRAKKKHHVRKAKRR